MEGPNSSTTSQIRKLGPPAAKNAVNYVNRGEEDQMEITGYKSSFICHFFTWIAILLTLGALRLVFHWRKHWMLVCTHTKCHLKYAEKVLLVDAFNQIFVEDVITVTSHRSYKPSLFHRRSNNKSNAGNSKCSSKSFDIEYYGSVASPDLLRPKANGSFEPVDSLTYFDNKKLRYIWSSTEESFKKVPSLDRDIELSYFYRQEGLPKSEQEKRRVLYGNNEIEVRVQSILQILFNEVLGPFYVFQVFSIILWGFEEYMMYASCIIIMSSLSLISSVVQIRKNQMQLRDTVVGVDTVTVCRGQEFYEEIESAKLVPGDVIVIPPHGCVMQCDAVLVSGNVIVNESMLTGESVPVTKTPLPMSKDATEQYDSTEHAKHTLFCGTKVIQTRFYDGAKVKAVVLRTGFCTAKGELVRSIMFPKPVDFKFNRHIYKFIQYLAVVAAAGFIYTVILKAQRQVPISDILLKSLDLITIVIPPALPMAMTIGVIFAQSRLKKSDIYCISPRSINISGCINCVCFDKTGTLTEDDLSFSEVRPVNPITKFYDEPVEDVSTLPSTGHLITCLATCHGLTLIDGAIIGDPLDQKMFAATGWNLEEPAVDDTTKYDLLAPTVVKPPPAHMSPKFQVSSPCVSSSETVITTSTTTTTPVTTIGIPSSPTPDGDLNTDEVGILRQFPFSSSLQRMSVVTRRLKGTSFEVYVKGAPEVIVSLCEATSIPSDFDLILSDYTKKGFRVLALAYRPLTTSYVKMQRATREDIEKNLSFLGLLVMGNMLKPETTRIIDILQNADIRCVMVTGDNMLTALSVARECHMIQTHHRVVIVEAFEPDDERPFVSWHFADTVNSQTAVHRTSVSSDQIKVFFDPRTVDLNIRVAITGKTFRILREYFPDLLTKVIIRGSVFARMAPDQKQQLIEMLQDTGYYVGMCGDGANDCGALKAAHAGVSLSETEASVASPFTSKEANISCIPVLIREGRASLVTAFGILKYMACYSICQFASVILLYTLMSNLTDFQFLYQDLFLISLFFVVFAKTDSYPTLAKKPPPSSLIGITPLFSMGIHTVYIIGFQIAAAYLLWRQPWYKPKSENLDDTDDFKCDDNYAIFSVSVFQYITLAVVFSKGAPYRKAIYTNYLFLLSLIVMTILTIYIVLYPADFIANLFEMDLSDIPMDFRIMILMLAVINFILAFITESFLVDYLIFIKFKKWLNRVTSSETEFEKILRETRNTDWLPHDRDKADLTETYDSHETSKNTLKSSPSVYYNGHLQRSPSDCAILVITN